MAVLFDLLWSTRLRENRLKYPGTIAPLRMTDDQLLRNAVMTVDLSAIGNRVVKRDRAIAALPDRPLKAYLGDPASLQKARSHDPRRGADPSSFPELVELPPPLDEGVGFRSQVTTMEPVVGFDPAIESSKEGLDTDLFADRRRECASRLVYSINLGLHDDTPVPPVLEDCAHSLLTDARTLQSYLPWRIMRPTLSERDRKRLCLSDKCHPHRLFPDAEDAIWIDANIECRSGDMSLRVQEARAEVATSAHPDRDCIHEEAEAVVKLGLDGAEMIDRCVERMRAAGMPEHGGLFETSVLGTRPCDYGAARSLDRRSRRIFLGSWRDQMSFSNAAFPTGTHVSPLDGRDNAITSRFFAKRPHPHPQGAGHSPTDTAAGCEASHPVFTAIAETIGCTGSIRACDGGDCPILAQDDGSPVHVGDRLRARFADVPNVRVRSNCRNRGDTENIA